MKNKRITKKNDENAQRSADRRSIPASLLFEHALGWEKRLGAQITLLQIDWDKEEEKDISKLKNFKRLDKHGDWEDTATYVEKLELVITVDTAMAHLADCCAEADNDAEQCCAHQACRACCCSASCRMARQALAR